jgi:hypothetical protein
VKERAETVAGFRGGGSRHPVFVEEGIADHEFASAFARQVGEGEGEGIVSFIEDCAVAA